MSLRVDRIGDAYYATNNLAVLEFSRLTDHRDGIASEVTATVLGTGDSQLVSGYATGVAGSLVIRRMPSP